MSRPELDGFAVWVVEWTQIIYLGEEEWPWPREPGPVLFAFDPDSGEGKSSTINIRGPWNELPDCAA